MSNRAQRRADLADFKREASHSLLTYLVEPDDAALADAPLLRRAAHHWLAALAVRSRHCIICSEWLWNRQRVGLLLLSTPSANVPTSASVCAVCRECTDLPLGALERAAESVLQAVIPGGRLEPLDTPR